jgi:SAM-dependent methyltransferase
VSGLSDADRNAIAERYAARFAEHGVDLRALNPGDPEKYRRQHEVHASVGDLDGATILDVGCGLAHYYEFLRARGQRVRYIGYDIVAPFLDADRERFPEAEFHLRDVTCKPVLHEADYAVMCQVFNNRYEHADNREVVRTALRATFAKARRGVSIDMLSAYVNYEEPHLFYFSPEEMFAFAKSLTPFVRLRHDYLPHHFTLFLYREAVR